MRKITVAVLVLVCSVPFIAFSQASFESVSLYMTAQDYTNQKTTPYLGPCSFSFPHSASKSTYQLPDNSKQILVYKESGAWGMLEGDVTYRFYPALKPKIDPALDMQNAKAWNRYQILFAGSLILYGDFPFTVSPDLSTYSGTFSSVYGIWVSKSPDSPLYVATWEALSIIVKDDQELYDKIMNEFGKYPAAFKATPSSEKYLNQYVELFMEYNRRRAAENK